ncbi:comEA protein [Pasteurella dagmatis ATCC 43325]|uniref:ComEA protein n=2 Tax=Pasteurella dagmatis TaxID=754 RepID=C9PNI8_9PAST|nr:comEA protein [Pasteurella dagmatis ATCC 43325]
MNFQQDNVQIEKEKTMKFKPLLISLLAGFSLLSSSSVSAETVNVEAKTVVQQNLTTGQQTVTQTDQVNINTATAIELQKALIGIGTKKAEAIVQYREAHGPFTAAEQLMEVQGIGKATLEKNKSRIAL